VAAEQTAAESCWSTRTLCCFAAAAAVAGLHFICLQYLVVSICGYAALGNDVPASIVLGFDSAPIWVTLLANLMVLIHMVPAYQVRDEYPY
jgi:hypothetical protein